MSGQKKMTVNALYNAKIAHNSIADLIGSEPVANGLDDRSSLSSISIAGLPVCGESDRSEAFVSALGVELVRAGNNNGHSSAPPLCCGAGGSRSS
jgi:hypothetical protein